MTNPYLQTYSSNPDDDAIIAEELLQLAAIHASLSQAQSLRELLERRQ